jgi:hypothetical protein
MRGWSVATGEMLCAEELLKEKGGEGGLAIAVTPAAHPVQMFAVAGADGFVRVFGPQ